VDSAPAVVSCEHGNKPFGSIKVKNTPAPNSWDKNGTVKVVPAWDRKKRYSSTLS
jgi:hypothetical protein